MHADEIGAILKAAAVDLDDTQLMAAIAGGDRGAFEVLYERHSRALLLFLSRTLDDEGLAEEIVQDTFVAIWKKPTFNAQSSARTWIFAIANRRYRDGSRRPRLKIVAESLDRASFDNEPEARAIASAAATELAREISYLSRVHKEVLYLAFIEQLSHSEIGHALGIPFGTVKSRLVSAIPSVSTLSESVCPDKSLS